MEYKPRHLVMVTTANNNKFYDQIPNGDGTWTAEYGRVGSGKQTRTYSMGQWDKKYREKIKKGYVDQTSLVEDLITVQNPKKPKYRAIENKSIAEIVERLQSMARQAISKNYTVSSNVVTQAMVDTAQRIIDGLVEIETECDQNKLSKFNSQLLLLFTTIPRKMGNVNEYLARNTNSLNKIIKREQDLLDVMRGQVVQKRVMGDSDIEEPETDCTILDKLGLIFEECNDNDIARIKAELGTCANRFYKAWKVTNRKTQKAHDEYVATNNITDNRLLFHGSRSENWWSIINTGLVLRPTNAVINGKMFGYGLYFAPKAQKSLGYTSLSGSYWTSGYSSSGFMALMDVAYGKPYDVYSFNSKFYNFNYDVLRQNCPNANCLHAHAGSMLRNDEIIVYKEEQCTIKYLIELK